MQMSAHNFELVLNLKNAANATGESGDDFMIDFLYAHNDWDTARP